MTNQIVHFVYDKYLVRTITLENGEPGFYATDVAKVLGHTDVSMMVEKLDDDEKVVRKVETNGGKQINHHFDRIRTLYGPYQIEQTPSQALPPLGNTRSSPHYS